MKTYKATIQGIRPLLHNKKLEDETIKKRGEGQDCEADAELKVYTLGNKAVLPTEQIERAMDKVASSFKLKGQGKKTYKDLIQGAVFLKPEFAEITPQKWVVDKRSVVIPSTRGRITRYRPKFPEWKVGFEIEVMDDRITPEILKLVLDEAGRMKGVGDGRNIGMGRFIVTEFKPTK